MKGMNREPGSITPQQAGYIQHLLPEWEAAVDGKLIFSCDWDECSAWEASMLIGGMRDTIAGRR